MARNQVDQEDQALNEEFSALSTSWRSAVNPVQGPSSVVNRRIREQARYHLGDRLKENWLMGHLPVLWLGICVFFAISLYVILSMDHLKEVGAGELDFDPDNRVLHGKTPVQGWIKLSFRVKADGLARDVIIIERCLHQGEAQHCNPAKDFYLTLDQALVRNLEIQAIRAIQSQKLTAIPGRHEQTLWISEKAFRQTR
ncbi:MAG: hypothetical protein OEZ23_10070 [Gammaproteobacteria bacterium]|nr:hypothetical protein [Gammaproteobacteria bacterium]